MVQERLNFNCGTSKYLSASGECGCTGWMSCPVVEVNNLNTFSSTISTNMREDKTVEEGEDK
ncbi:hypothetical protein SERLA73DRAFT_144474 [Serpula lacrymans var. lacrymans S7.3]|uniref:Uncharacterized protein n=2 Tax=Serpula lacrymans var. lacrymans TaxID=341189 RepID=F8QBT8_SERL3|nr:uncharacterized protein SERLADRAFT_401668 [Serpula lacrymans var. lacrymans S7.9]EGN94057.1 hypothetical protein SERLA73DRAFT_144474 [Serpula lacrymans var. lacrymans S7.3]EGO19411.1 hypothetical protein SERLADRAFT_401668 [Serpula lacrymans var. lacrymans S7.9]